MTVGPVSYTHLLVNGKYFVAMNNSKKIEIVDPVTFKSVGTILYTQAGYPRHVVPISSTEAIVSDLDRQLVRIRTVEPYGKPLEYISIPRAVEYLAVAENKVFGITPVSYTHLDVYKRQRQYQPTARNRNVPVPAGELPE